ncbi:LANO_0F03796g1_1 [Lachancea nothofagi CBS 11611]|uniref:Ubiquitin carboxyl-terminal hydrolase n=1 Tax=Lachancea nothofagi CBS 11611 TaxID=1266666 RepID=A0A1G4K7A2_9SACH|nr:LANO_0F03796g1_1 [Lachancea nothofagi CBS 11611]
MPHSQLARPHCKSATQLIQIADKFVKQDGGNQDMETLLQECIDTLVNYQEECKKLRKWGHKPPIQDPEVFETYEAAYVYYKIVSQLVLNKIPELPQFVKAKNSAKTEREKGLIELYNMLVKTLLTDEKFADIRKFIKDNSRSDSISAKKGLNHDHNIIDTKAAWKNGQALTLLQLTSLLQSCKVLLIDLRPRMKFIESHIKTEAIICIEPISFKDNYSDTEIIKRSLITSPNREVSLFRDRDKFDFIVIYTDMQDKTHFCQQRQEILVKLLVERSFEKPLQGTKVCTLEGGFQNWCRNEGLCETTKTSDESGYAMDYSIPPLAPRSMGLTKPAPLSSSYSSSRISNFDTESGPGANVGSSQVFPYQQMPNLRRNSSFKEKLSSISRSLSRTGSPSLEPSSDLYKESAKYPDTPQLALSGPQLNSLSQLNPHDPKIISPHSKSLSPPRLNGNSTPGVHPNGGFGPSSFSNKYSTTKELSPLPISRRSESEAQLPQPMLNKKTASFCVGLVNLGNSCYMNCIIQCLLGTYELCQIFLDDSYKNHVNLNSKLGSKGVLAKYFSQLVHTMQQKAISASASSKNKLTAGHEKTAVQPINFKVACGSINSLFKGSSQQDCQEFCQFLLDGLHEDLNQCGGNPSLKELSEEAEKIREKLCMRIASSIEWERYLTTDFSVIVDLFQGQYASQLMCKVCGRKSTTYQPFSVLSVPVPRGSRCDIIDCFKEFTKVETLEKDEQWSCPQCKIKQPSTKKITITRLPRNLILHLKRFDNLLNKNNIFVSYPHTLDLTSFWANDFDGRLPPGVSELPTRGQVPPFNYNLYAVACHFGTLYGGHYTSYLDKGPPNGWCYFDDTSWRRAKSDHECITTSAYVLFYHRTPNSTF